MTEWRTLSFRDAGIALIDCVHATPQAVDSGYPYIAIPQMKGGHIDFEEARRISEADFIEWTRKARPRLHDVVLSRRTNPGVTAVVRDGQDFALGQNLVLLRANGETVLPQFLRWMTRGPQWWGQVEKFMNVGAVFNSLRCADVPRFELLIPPKHEQAAIAQILDDLDDKIELNRQMNKTLEAMAQAIFRDWFVDFGPTRRKMDGATDPVEIMGGIVADPDRLQQLADLFPANLSDEGFPQGWRKEPFSAFVNIIGGGTPKTSVEEYWGGDVPWYSVVDTPAKGSVFVHTTEKSITKKGLSESSARLVRAGTTIISARGTVGNLAVAATDMVFNQSCYGLQGSGGVGDCFVILAAQQVVDRLKAMAHGSIFSTITRATFDGIELARADLAVLRVFEEVVSPLFSRIKSAGQESRSLKAIRDLLLPKLMLAEIRLRDLGIGCEPCNISDTALLKT